MLYFYATTILKLSVIRCIITKERTPYGKNKKKVQLGREAENGNGSFKSLISLLELYETSARICHPQSNGKLERFHSTLKTEHVRKTPYFGYEDAKEKMAQWIDFYNNGRLHGALLYLTPADYFEGRKESRLQNEEKKFIMQISTEKLIGCNSSRLKPSYKLS